MTRALLPLLVLGACAPAAGPTADAGFNVHGAPGQIFAFDGSASAGDSLTFRWTVLDAPAQADFILEDADRSEAMLIPETEGTYVLMNLRLAGLALAEVERNIRLHEQVLRYMFVRQGE